MNKNKLFLLSLIIVMTLVFSTVVFAEPASQYYGGGCADANYQAEFVADVNYPDGTYVAPGQKFIKTWRLANTGNICWGTGTRLVFTGGDSMGGTSVPIPYMVCPKQTVDISVNLTAPSIQGTASGQWKLQAPDGLIFGVGCGGQTPITVNISTWRANGSTNCYCAGQTNCSCAPCNGTNCSPYGSRSGKNPYCNNKIRTVKDMTVPDGTVVAPGTVFRKTWRMKNAGTCVWDENYMMIFAGGDNVGSSQYIRLNPWNILRDDGLYGKVAATRVYPGQWVEFSVDITAPTTPGEYTAYYKLRDNYGYEFGFGPYASEAFWVKFTVSDSLTTSPSSKDPLPAGNSTLVSKSADIAAAEPAAAEAEEQTLSCSNQNIALNKTEKGYKATWSALNNGSAAWENCKLQPITCSDNITIDTTGFDVPATQSNERNSVSFDIELDEEKNPDFRWLEFQFTCGGKTISEFSIDLPTK